MIKALLIATALLVIVACSETESDKLGDAQICIDQATQSNVDSCLSDISGITSTKAYELRCAAHYIKQEFTADKWTSIIEAFTSSDSSNPIIAVAPYLAFVDEAELNGGAGFDANGDGDTTDEASDLVDLAEADCEAADSPGLSLFVGLSQTSTVMSGLSSIENIEDPTPEDYEAAISELEGEDAETVGETIITINEQYCGGTSSSDAEFCDDLETVVGDDADAESVGEKARCYMEFDTVDLATEAGTGDYDNDCTNCNRLNCRVILGVDTTNTYPLTCDFNGQEGYVDCP